MKKYESTIAPRKNSLLFGALFGLTALVCPWNSRAVVSIWINPLGGSWTNAANWQGGVIPSNVDDVADFSAANITSDQTVTINSASITVGQMIFGGTTGNWTLSAGTNRLAVSSGVPIIQVNSGQNVTISSTLAGNQGFSLLGAGTLTLSGVNTLTNGILANDGSTLSLLSAKALGGTVISTANSLTLSNAQLITGGSLTTLTNDFISAGTSNLITSRPITLVGSIKGSGTVTINQSGGNFNQRGQMTNFSGTLIFNNPGGGFFFMGQNDDASTGGGSGVSGSPNAAFVYNGGSASILYNGAIPATCYMGSLSGASGVGIYSKFNRAGNVILKLGYLNTSTTYAGTLGDINNQGINTTTLGLSKFGTGTFELSGPNTYTGPTTVSAGTLNVSGSLANTPVTVASGAALLLNGSIGSSNLTVSTGGSIVVASGGNLGGAAIALGGLMDVSAFGGYFCLNSASLSGSGVVTGAVTLASSTMNPGPLGAAGTLTITNGDFTVNGGTLAFDLSNDATNGLNDLLAVNGSLNLAVPATVSINALSGTLGGGNYPLIKFTGAFSGDLANLTLIGAGPLDQLVRNGQEIYLVVNPAPSVVWTGNTAGALWDIVTSTNWLLGASPATFTNGYTATFNNAGGIHPIVNIPATVIPTAVVVSGSSNYTFTGAGDISGGGSLLKSGTGKLTILNANTFLGATLINGGTVQLGDGVTADGTLAGNIANNTTLVFANPFYQTYGGVISGSGTLSKQSAGTLFLTGASTATGPTTISAGALSLGDGSSPGTLGSGIVTNNAILMINSPSGMTLSNTITGTGQIVNLVANPVTLAGNIAGSCSLVNDFSASGSTLILTTSNSYSGGTYINAGTVQLNNFAGLGTGNVIIDDNGGGALSFAAPLGTTNNVSNNIRLPAAPTGQFSFPIGRTATVRLTGVISGGAAGVITPFLTSPNNNVVKLSLENPNNSFTTTPGIYQSQLSISSDGALGNPTNGLYLSANFGGVFRGTSLGFGADNITLNSNRLVTVATKEQIDVQNYSAAIAGPITGDSLIKVGSGTLRVTGSGSLSGDTVISNGVLRVDCPWTSANIVAAVGSTLSGTGAITASVTVQSGGILAPGPAIGTLTVNGDLTLAAGSATIMQINASAVTRNQVAGLQTIAYDGTLTVQNTGGTPAPGQSYRLFSATNYAGNFSATNLPPLGTGLAWAWTPASGTLSVLQIVATNRTNLTTAVSGGNLSLSWPTDHLGWRVETNAVSLAATNSWFTYPGSSSVTNLTIPIGTAGHVFFRMAYP